MSCDFLLRIAPFFQVTPPNVNMLSNSLIQFEIQRFCVIAADDEDGTCESQHAAI